MANWNSRFTDMLNLIASWSKDRNRKVGAIIVRETNIIATGYNGFPRGVNDDVDTRHQRPDKYLWTAHAEQNAINDAARHGKSTNGCTMYTSYFPCSMCASSIINSGISEVITPPPNMEKEKWAKSFEVSLQMFKESDIKVTYI